MTLPVVSSVHGVETRMGLEDGALVFGTVQDCTPIVEDAQARHRAGFHGTAEVKHAARLPSVVVERYCNENGIDFAEFMGDPVHVRRVLNDPALAAFRIWPGKV